MGQQLGSRRRLDTEDRLPPPGDSRDRPPVSSEEPERASHGELGLPASYLPDFSQLQVRMGQTLIEIDEPPWRTPNYEVIRDMSAPISLSSFVDKQQFALPQNWGYFGRGEPDDLRLHLWGLLQLAAEGSIPAEDIFVSSRTGKQFTLAPLPRSSVPLQRVHRGARTISNPIADTLCSTMNSSDILDLYNDVLGSDFQLNDPGLRECLEHFIASSMDFGQLYGHLRHMQRPDFEHALSTMEGRRRSDEALRKNILQGTYISNAEVPPRRVWDLFSNRVLPFHALPESRTGLHGGSPIPESLWTVSHSWVGTRARRDVWTSINGKQWPVPIPKGTTLDHVRVELLNLGAEYVWLDVLCLRQHGSEPDEALRVEEWKLDVPTIGYIYSIPRKPCITYFNGLGLPFDARRKTRASDRHWLHRVWTVQEATASWLPGGATSKMSRDAVYFFRERLPRAIPASSIYPISIAVTAVQQRCCTTPLDRVHGLAYVLKCNTLPIYEEGMSPERAWTLLLKHVPPSSRVAVAAIHMDLWPESTSILPSWAEFTEYTTYLDGFSAITNIHLADRTCLGTYASGTYFQRVKRAGIFYVTQVGHRGGHFPVFEPFVRPANGDFLYPSDDQIKGDFEPGIKYMVQVFNSSHLMIVEVVGSRQIEGENALEVVKRGRIAMSAPLSGQERLQEVTVVYLGANEVRPNALK